MASDPNVSLNIAPQPASTMANPLAMLSTYAETQNALNQNRLFQQTFQARQVAGQIMSSSPDLETGMQRLMASPVAPFMGDFYNSVRQGALAQIQMQGEQQTQALSGKDVVLKSLGAIAADPVNLWDPVMKANLSLMSPSARAALVPYINSLRDGLLTGLPADAAQAGKKFNANLSAMWVAGGAPSPDQYANVYGSQQMIQRGGGIVPAVRAPAAMGSGLTQTGDEVPMTLAPTLTTVPTQAGATQPGIASGAGTFNSLTGPVGGNGLQSAPAKPIVGPSMEAQDYLHKVGGNMADFESDLNQTVMHLVPQMLRLKVERQALSGGPGEPGAQIGGWGEDRAKLAQFLQGARNAGVPIAQDWINTVGNKNLTNSQVFKALAATQSAAQYQQAVQGTGRGFQLEYQAFNKSYPNLSTDPAATEKIYNFIQATGEKYYRMQQDLMNFKHQITAGALPGYTLSDFPAYEDQKMFNSGQVFKPVNPFVHNPSGAKPKRPLTDFLQK